MASPNLLAQLFGKVASILPASRTAEGSANELRQLAEGSLSVVSETPDRNALAAEGALFTAMNPTIGTAVTYALQTSFSATAAAYWIFNGDNPTTGKDIYLDFLRLIAGAVAATTTSVRCLVQIDSANRQPTAGSVALTPKNVNMTGPGSIAQVSAFSAAAMTVPTSGATARNIDQATLNQHIPIAGDELVVRFGQVDVAASSPGTAAAITISGRYTTDMQAVCIPPGSCALIYLWQPGAATTAPTYEFTLGWREKF
jgi:hypothetical protein